MKVELEDFGKEIDWNEPQLVIDGINKMVILTTGENKGNSFSGTILYKGSSDYGSLKFSNGWGKNLFSKLSGRLTIQNN